jgi:hypothetical protein
MATSFGIMPTGRPSWQSRRAGEPGACGLLAGSGAGGTSGPGCGSGDRLRVARAAHGRDPSGL